MIRLDILGGRKAGGPGDSEAGVSELKDDPDYYVRHREAFLKDFDKQSPPFARVLQDRFPGESERIVALARAEFAEVLPHLQYIGGGWDCEIVEGDEYDWGIDITRCGVCKLYDAQGAGEFTKWACPSDFAMTKSLHIGMRRTQTLSPGDERCDFRFNSDWIPEDDWPPEFARNRSRD